MDEVIADTIGKFITMYKERHNEEISLGNMEGKEFREILPSFK